MAIDPERVKVLLRAAIESEDPACRRAFLDAEVSGDAELLHLHDARLAVHDRAPRDLDRPIGADPKAADAPDAAPSPIDKIIADRYKIRQEIGEGGMGTVYLAEQLRAVRRRVALKLIKRGMDSRNVLARFESERQALALMEHPHPRPVLCRRVTHFGPGAKVLI
jgi:hypothetical protein